ncbi:hypothetical protein [Bernardetia sp. MNP-M8]|uniref:hypothetical protein n=2 Tax=unclassified Bernardetia TaxID=2647129 RepID=UPI0030D48D03
MKIYKLLFFLVLNIFAASFSLVSAQGGWDIGYFPIQHLDSMYEAFKGKEIKLDFREDLGDTVKITGTLIDNMLPLSRKDTVAIRIFDSLDVFVEHWETYVDQGYFKKQYLKGINENSFIEIRNIILKAIDENYLYLTVEITGVGFQPNKDIILDRKLVKGILYEIE